MNPDQAAKDTQKPATKPQLTKEQIDCLKPILKRRIPVDEGPGCFLCKWIYEDLEKNEKLTDYPKGSQEGQFPEAGKYQHLKLEGMIP